MSSRNLFAHVERLLAEPAADGVFLYTVRDGSPFHEAGFRAGDILQTIGGEPLVEARDLFMALQPQEGESGPLTVELVRGGEILALEAPRDRKGIAACAVEEGEPAWEDLPDTEYTPDFSALRPGRDLWLRCSLGEERAGFERILFAHDNDLLVADTLFRIGGEMEEGKTWDYRTRAKSAHRLDRTLSVRRTEFAEGAPGQEKLAGRVALGEDGMWRGLHAANEVEFADSGVPGITAYSATLLPLTMPLEEGARLTFTQLGEGTGIPVARHRLECVGRQAVEIDGGRTEAWAFAWRHYGKRDPADDEHFFVDDERNLVRVQWGPGYGNCWCIAVPEERLLDGVPPHVTLE